MDGPDGLKLSEASFSHGEKIGMPNWSHATINVSASTACPKDQKPANNDYLAAIVIPFVRERMERIALGMALMQGVPEAECYTALDIEALPGEPVWLSYTMTRRIAFEDRSSIDIFDTVREMSVRGNELATFRECAAEVNRLFSTKYALIKNDPRPWRSAT